MRAGLSAVRRSIGLSELVALIAAVVVGGGLISVAVSEKQARTAQDKRTVARALVQNKKTVALALVEQRRVDRALAATVLTNCQSIEALKVQVRVSLRRARKTLPTLAYYREHRAELRVQLDLIGDELVQFQRRRCTAG